MVIITEICDDTNGMAQIPHFSEYLDIMRNIVRLKARTLEYCDHLDNFADLARLSTQIKVSLLDIINSMPPSVLMPSRMEQITIHREIEALLEEAESG